MSFIPKTVKLNLGCGPMPLHQQHLTVMGGDIRSWILVDKYVQHPMIKNWDATVLDEVEDGSAEHIYASHLLEHLPHTEIRDILALWKRKLTPDGRLTINVPDLVWGCSQVLRYASGQILSGYFYEFDGEHGLLSVLYGSEAHEGEYHKTGFVDRYLEELLEDVGFTDIKITAEEDAHSMGVLIATARNHA
jgi:hypothetical protein